MVFGDGAWCGRWKRLRQVDSPQENGMEACIGSLKSKIRRLLKGAELFWPMAARYAVAAEEKRFKGERMVASFGEEVWVRLGRPMRRRATWPRSRR